MRQGLVCVVCFDVEWQWVNHIGAWREPRAWWTCKKCIPEGGFEGEKVFELPANQYRCTICTSTFKFDRSWHKSKPTKCGRCERLGRDYR